MITGMPQRAAESATMWVSLRSTLFTFHATLNVPVWAMNPLVRARA